ncbi:hypothetical protein DFS34DRAFT_668217 [Phlyctochytrium arcticum]|nr:hypothetical protein DFS34DRAFT_668217 [Phlyctochytrium arcticum]
MFQLRAANAIKAQNSSIWYRRQRLFNPVSSFQVPLNEFDTEWKLGDNFWTQLHVSVAKRSGIKKITFKCKFDKHRKSKGKRSDDEGEPKKKRRVTSTFNKVACDARLEVSIDERTGQVTIQHKPGYAEHGEGHDIHDADDRKLCSHASDYIKAEASSPYAHADIAHALPEIIGRALSPSRISALGLDRISARAVYNARWREREDQAAPPDSLTSDVSQAIQLLREEGYIIERFFSGSGEQADEGFEFVVEPGLRLLSTNSYLVLLDSTHKTNRYDWRLFTCMVRDNFGSWLPAAQFFVSTENADAVAKGLLQLRKMVREVQAFPGMAAGKEEIKIRFCTVHVVRTLMRRVASHHNAFAKILIALNKTTDIQRNWTNREEMECWTMGARQHSPILLQTMSTNPLESYHRLVKANKNCGKHSGILKACRSLCKVNKQRRVEADRSEILFRKKTVKNLELYPQVAKFPHPVQQLLIEQIMAVEKLVAKGKAVPAYSTLEC